MRVVQAISFFALVLLAGIGAIHIDRQLAYRCNDLVLHFAGTKP